MKLEHISLKVDVCRILSDAFFQVTSANLLGSNVESNATSTLRLEQFAIVLAGEIDS